MITFAILYKPTLKNFILFVRRKLIVCLIRHQLESPKYEQHDFKKVNKP